jgi:hypothetical protein
MGRQPALLIGAAKQEIVLSLLSILVSTTTHANLTLAWPQIVCHIACFAALAPAGEGRQSL